MDQLIQDVLGHEGVVSIITEGPGGAHLVATWNSYIAVKGTDTLLIPAGFYHQTEDNIKAGSKMQIMIGSKEVQGKMGPGTGFRLSGSAKFLSEGEDFERTKSRFPWTRAVVAFTVEQSEQLI